ncbi:MAG: histidine kinase dimerization/phosphoacceptor domain -containing protein [Marinoscillum sp.]
MKKELGWNQLLRRVGGSGNLSLEHVVFNLLVFILIIFGLLATGINIALKLHWAVISLSIFGVSFLLSLYYHSRVVGHFTIKHIWVLVITSISVLGVIFFLNGGADGPLAFIYIMVMTVVIMISPENIQLKIFILFFIVLVGLYVADWALPFLTIIYESRDDRYIDTITTLAYSVLFIAMTVIAFKRSYNQEKKETAIKNEELIHLNATLVKKNDQIQLLMRELNHRVKNNLQVVSDMLSLQANRSNDSAIAAALKDGKDRLMSMALLHKKFYDEKSMYLVGLTAYILDIQTYLIEDPKAQVQNIHIINEIEEVQLSQNQALPFGLIINEVITNIQKHAFQKPNKTPEISFRCKVQDKVLNVQIQDNGVGIEPGKAQSWEGSFGLELINLLVMQIDGNWKIYRSDASGGTVVEVNFPLNQVG